MIDCAVILMCPSGSNGSMYLNGSVPYGSSSIAELNKPMIAGRLSLVAPKPRSPAASTTSATSGFAKNYDSDDLYIVQWD